MKYTPFILIGLIVLASVFFVVTRNRPDSAVQQQTKKSSFETQTSDQGQVSIKVTPEVLSEEQGKFKIIFDTHSVDLNQDLMQVAVLVDDQGSIYNPKKWEGSGPGGHHREGVLIFESISGAASYVELSIKNIGGVPERLFKWSLK